KQAVQLDRIRRAGGAAWRAYTHKEAVREIFQGDLDEKDASELIDRAISRCQRSRLQPFVKFSRTLREHKDGILASIRLGISNARAEALNTKVRNIIRRAYGFHSAEAAIALVMLACGPVELRLPHEMAAV
ncbi:MAG: ISL3 family transposase, partial [Actinomycetota bacterium]